MKVVCNFKINNDSIELFPTGSYRAEMLYTLQQCEKECNSFCAVEVKKPYKSRSSQANRLYWAIVQQICQETGEDIDSIHQELKRRAIKRGYGCHISKITGELIPDSSAKSNTVEFSYLIEEAKEVCAFLGIVIDETGE